MGCAAHRGDQRDPVHIAQYWAILAFVYGAAGAAGLPVEAAGQRVDAPRVSQSACQGCPRCMLKARDRSREELIMIERCRIPDDRRAECKHEAGLRRARETLDRELRVSASREVPATTPDTFWLGGDRSHSSLPRLLRPSRTARPWVWRPAASGRHGPLTDRPGVDSGGARHRQQGCSLHLLRPARWLVGRGVGRSESDSTVRARSVITEPGGRGRHLEGTVTAGLPLSLMA